MASLLRICLRRQADPAPAWVAQAQLSLPADAVRHVQVRRLQPGDTLQVFDGQGSEWRAQLLDMGRQSATLRLLEAIPSLPELGCAVTLALAVPANDRMDSLVEKATELGVHAIQPLLTQRSVLRLEGERAAKRVAHWQSVAASAAEQSGRAWVPAVQPWCGLEAWLTCLADRAGPRWLLSPPARLALAEAAEPCLPGFAAPVAAAARRQVYCLSGPEGGLSDAEEALALAHGFVPVNLGPRVLRADTAPLAVMAWLSLLESGRGRHSPGKPADPA